MSFPTLDRLVILTAEHVYSGRPGDRFRVHGLFRSEITQYLCYLLLIQCLTGATETCFTLLAIFAGKSRGRNHCSFGDYAVRRPFFAKFPADPLERFVPSNVYMAHPTPLPAWCECRAWLGRCSACECVNGWVTDKVKQCVHGRLSEICKAGYCSVWKLKLKFVLDVREGHLYIVFITI